MKRRYIDEEIPEIASTPSTPDAGFKKLYPKTDGKWYVLDSSGTEKEISLMPKLDDIWATIASLTTATTLYSANDQLGDELTFAVAVASGKGAIINDASYVVLKPGVILGGVDLYLFKSASTPAGNNNAADWTDANIDDNFLGMISFEKPVEGASNGIARGIGGLPITVKGNASVNIYGVAVTRVAHTVHFAAATDMIFRLGVAQES